LCLVTNNRKLDGKIALITGVGGGQGREAARQFAAEGATVVGCDIDAAAAADAIAAVRDAGLDADIETNGIDLGEPEEARGWVEGAADRHGRIDVVYNNASAARFGSIAELSVEDWRFTIRNELDLVFFVTKYAWPILVRSGGGTVINVASVAGWTGNRSVPFVAHMASKGGVIAMTKTVALDYAAKGITANTVPPFVIDTPMLREQQRAGKLPPSDYLTKAIPAGRLGSVDDVAALCSFLCSNAAGYITGQNILIDGGAFPGAF